MRSTSRCVTALAFMFCPSLTTFCTVTTIKKFRYALAKHSHDRCSLGGAKGLKEKELVALTSNKHLSFSYGHHLLWIGNTPKSLQSRCHLMFIWTFLFLQ